MEAVFGGYKYCIKLEHFITSKNDFKYNYVHVRQDLEVLIHIKKIDLLSSDDIHEVHVNKKSNRLVERSAKHPLN